MKGTRGLLSMKWKDSQISRLESSLFNTKIVTEETTGSTLTQGLH